MRFFSKRYRELDDANKAALLKQAEAEARSIWERKARSLARLVGVAPADFNQWVLGFYDAPPGDFLDDLEAAYRRKDAIDEMRPF